MELKLNRYYKVEDGTKRFCRGVVNGPFNRDVPAFILSSTSANFSGNFYYQDNGERVYAGPNQKVIREFYE